MQRFQTMMLAAAWQVMLLVSQATLAQTAPLCCTAGQTRIDCLEQRENYLNRGIVCRDPVETPSRPAAGAAVNAPLVVRPAAAGVLPACCTADQSRTECLEQREKFWTLGIACQDLPAAQLPSNVAGSSPRPSSAPAASAAAPSQTPPVTQAAAGTSATTPPSAPPSVNAVATPTASLNNPAAAPPPVQGKPAATATAASPLPAKSDLPACCSKGQSKMDCLEQRERMLTMGIACQGGK